MLKLPWYRTIVGAAAAAVLAGGGAVVPASWAGTLYRWETDDGVVSFTDDARRIPPRYQQTARVEERESLQGYARLTPADPGASARYAERLAERLERLRAVNAEPPAVRTQGRAPAEARSPRLSLRTGGEQPTIELDVSGETSGPVVVEVMRLRDSATLATRHVTVVRQGDRVLSVVDPRKWMEAPSSGDLQDLIAGR